MTYINPRLLLQLIFEIYLPTNINFEILISICTEEDWGKESNFFLILKN